ncbi:hypothetical protein N9W08_03760 [Porticoccaceae bacterium]|nr:hypothetical protein [Porticoccaceae bacterium]
MLRVIFVVSTFWLSSVTAAAALTSVATVVTHARQGVISASSGLSAPSTNYDLELTGQHVLNDILSFHYSSPLAQGALSSIDNQFTCDRLTANSDSVVFGYLDGDETGGILRYRLIRTNNGSATEGFDSAGLHCVTPSVGLKANSLAELDEVALTVEISSGYGFMMDSVGPVTVANISDAYSSSVTTSFDQVVDVATGRRSFVGGEVDNSSDILDVTLTLTNGTDGDLLVKSSESAHSVTAGGAEAISPQTSGAVYTVEGDFTFLDTSLVDVGMQLGDNTVTMADYEVAFGDGFSTLTVSNFDDPNIAAGANTKSLAITKKEVDDQITYQDFTGQVEVYFNNNTQSVILPFSEGLGSWEWNGSEVWIYAMPFGESVSRSIGISNQGNYSFDVTATVHHQETIYGPYELGSAAPSAVTQFGEKLDQAINEVGDIINSGRGNIVLQLAAAEANTMVYGGYRLDSDLTFVNLATSAQSNLETP